MSSNLMSNPIKRARNPKKLEPNQSIVNKLADEKLESRNLAIGLHQTTREVVAVLGFVLAVQFEENTLPSRPSNRKKVKDRTEFIKRNV